MKSDIELPPEIILAIEEILDEFDWEAVKAHMEAVDWKWYVHGSCEEYEHPSFSRMRKAAKDLLLRLASDKASTISSGGFLAYSACGELGLKFILTGAEVTVEEQ